MKNILLTGLLLIAGPAIMISTSLIAMDQPRFFGLIDVINRTGKPIKIEYSKALYPKQFITKDIGIGGTTDIKQHEDSPLNQMFIKAPGAATIEVDPTVIVSLAGKSGTIIVSGMGRDITYSFIVKELPLIPKEILNKVLIENLSEELSYLDRNRGPIKIFESSGNEKILALNPIKKMYAGFIPYGPGVSPDRFPVFLREIETGKILKILAGHKSRLVNALFSPDGEKIATLDKDGMKVWKVSSGDLLQTFSKEPGAKDLAWSPNGENILILTDAVKMWNVSSGKELKTFPGANRPFAFSRDGNRIAALTENGIIGIWDVESEEKLMELPAYRGYRGYFGDIQKLLFSLDGKKLCLGTVEGVVELWEIATKRQLFSFKGHQDWITDILVSPDNKTIFTSSLDKTVKQWDMQSGAELKTLVGIKSLVESIAFSPEGEAPHLYVRDLASIYLFDLSSKPFDWLKFHINERQALLIEKAYRAKMKNEPLKLDSAGYKILMEIEDPTVRAFLVNSFSIQLPVPQT